ncbi:MAG: ATP-binding protein, partial [Methylococcales bacterium]|nr:ATP-binding protein [Methylococcales bacterium]
MLVEFSVANFKSIREQQTLKLTPVKAYKEHSDNVFSTGRTSENLLHTVAIYGANAAGKSSLLEALSYMETFVLHNSKMNDGEKTRVAPFKLGSSSYLEPSSFEIIFIDEGVRYQYGFSLTNNSIISEWLYVSPSKSAQIWFERDGENKDEWYLNRNLASKSDRDTWRRMTRSNALLLSVAVQLNSEKLQPVFNWFREKIVFLDEGHFGFTAESILDGKYKSKVLSYLNAADLTIIDLDVNVQKVSIDELQVLEKKLGSVPIELKEAVAKGEISNFEVGVMHTASQREPLNMDEESEGTQKLFTLVMPLINILERGTVVYIDELNNSLHPYIVRMIVDLFNNPETNPNHAQLIFTTH